MWKTTLQGLRRISLIKWTKRAGVCRCACVLGIPLALASWSAAQTYTISTFAGNGTSGFAGDNGSATSAEFADPVGIAIDSSGNIYIADQLNNRIRKISSSGTVTTVAGNGTGGYTGDGSAAGSGEVHNPE